MIDEEVRNALFKEIHRAIREASESVAQLKATECAYPPGVEFTDDEISALKSIQLTESAKSALIKIVADACAHPLFQFFTLLDGVADPESYTGDVWLGATIEDKRDDQDQPMLHDDFFESYWLYAEEDKHKDE